jgi:hypothetical protein
MFLDEIPESKNPQDPIIRGSTPKVVNGITINVIKEVDFARLYPQYVALAALFMQLSPGTNSQPYDGDTLHEHD